VKTIVVYYSRTGNTRKVAKAIAGELGCESKKITDLKDRSGVLGYISGGKDAISKKLTKIKEEKTKYKSYDVYIIGTPVWGSNPCPAIRTYLLENKKKLKKVAFFCTAGGGTMESTLLEMEKISEKTPFATLPIQAAEIKKEGFKDHVHLFAKKIKLKTKK